MNRIVFTTLLAGMIFMNPSTQAQDAIPPKAKKIAKKLVTHGHERIDNYYWLNDREDSEVINYLNRENAYTKSILADVKSLEKELFEEIVGRIKQDDSSVPYDFRGYTYYTRFNKGEQYPIFCRKKGWRIDGADHVERQ